MRWTKFVFIYFVIKTAVALSELRLPTKCASNVPTLTGKKSHRPRCIFSVSQENDISEIECPSSDVMRVVGNYDILHISCSASYPLNFDFDGTKPTEAIQAEFWRTVRNGSRGEILSFHVDVAVYSVSALHKFYKDERPEAELSDVLHYQYSRTGRYEFADFKNDPDTKTSFYIFFEEPLVSPALIVNRDIKPTYSKDGTWSVPCRSTHFHSNVTLLQNDQEKSVEQYKYSETSGFQILSALDIRGSLNCQLRHDDHFFNLDLSLQAYERRYNFQERNQDHQILYETSEVRDGLHVTKVRCRVSCKSCQEHDVAVLSSFGISNTVEDEFRRDFVLPCFRNKSYAVITETTKEDIAKEFKVTGIVSYTGTVFCGNDENAKLASFGRILNGSVYPFDYGMDWIKGVDRDAAPANFYIKILTRNLQVEMYDGEEITFKCRLQTFIMTKPAIWFVEWENGTLTESIDYDLVDGLSLYKLNLSLGMKKIYCSSSMHYQRHYRNDSVEIHVKPTVVPYFLNDDNQLIKYLSNSYKQSITCMAQGDPLPDVHWERDGGIIASINSKGYALLEFPKINEEVVGDYICIACNFVNCSRKDFTVEVVEPELLSTGWTIAVIGLISLVFWWQWRRQKELIESVYGLTREEIDEFRYGDGDLSDESKNGFEYAHALPFNENLELPRRKLDIQTKVLGFGEFGKVYYGLCDGEEVAVKTIKHKNRQDLKYLLSELRILSYLGSNEHLVELRGACTKELNKGTLYVVLKYCALGDMAAFLRRNQDNFQRVQSGYVQYNTRILTVRDLFEWSIQIAKAMAFLNEKNVTHGDLAARNVLLTSDYKAKLTDFGMARRNYEYVRLASSTTTNNSRHPWRWLAPECFVKMIPHGSQVPFSMDVWSYGVLLSEIFRLGEVPYPQFRDLCRTFVEELEQGLNPGQPELASDLLYNNVLIKCWGLEPNSRPSFKSIVKILEELPRDSITTENGAPVHYVQIRQIAQTT